MSKMWTSLPLVTGTAGTGTAVAFSIFPAPQTIVENTAATFNWLAVAPSAGTINYTIETYDEPGGGTGGTGWWDFGTQTGTSYTFGNVPLADTGTIIRITASNGVDTDAVATTTLTVTAAGSGGGSSGGGAGLTINRVYFQGHSLMNQGLTPGFNFSTGSSGSENTPDYIGTAMTAAGYVVEGVRPDSGSTAGAGLGYIQANRANWETADTIVLDYAINGDESASQFSADVTAINNYIRSVVPTMNIVWMEAHSHPTVGTGAQTNVQARWKNKNPVLRQKLADGEIDGLVPWESYAAANLSVYYSDGVHHWSDQRPYADQMVAYLDSLALDTTPGGGSGSSSGIPSRHMGFDNYADNHFGNPLKLTGPGNVHIKTQELAMPFKAVETGSLRYVSFNIKYNNANGYSGGTFGQLRCDIYNALSSGEPTGSSLGGFTLTNVTAPDGNTNNGHVGKHRLTSDVGVVAGQPYAIVISNVDGSPSTNFFSINLMVEYPDLGPSASSTPPDPTFRAVATGNGFFTPWIKGGGYWDPDSGGNWNNYEGRDGSKVLSWHNSCFEVYYVSGNRQGQSYVGGRYGDSAYERSLTGGVRFRQSMLSRRSGRTATHVCYSSGIARQFWPSGTVVGAILRNSSGSQLATASMTKAGAYWGRGQLSTAVPIAANTTYLLDIYLASGTAFPMRAMQTSLNGHDSGHGPWTGAGFSDLPGGGLYVSTDGGSSFSQPGGGAAYDLALYLETSV